MAVPVQLRRGTAAAWTAANTILSEGQEGYETDTGKRKVGDGATTWNALAYNGQPLDTDLTALAALTTTVIGRSLLEGATAVALRDILKIGPRWCWEFMVDFAGASHAQTVLSTEWQRSVSGTGAALNAAGGLVAGNAPGRTQLALGTTATGRAAVITDNTVTQLGFGAS